MIPQKLIIEGFLCYRTPQEIDLSGLPLCMLAGPNGSGESTVFDAITFALFGMHRGGKQNAEDLINKKCDTARVIYEFLLDGSAWQIYRTITKTIRGARIAGDIRRPTSKGAAEEWEVVPDTSTAAGLDNWVAAKLVLSGKAFTRSMMLRQGESDKLLSSEPRERFEVLAGIAELEKFQELETSVIDRCHRTQDETERLASQLSAILPVTNAELDQATIETKTAGQCVNEADELIAALQQRHAHAVHWADFNSKLEHTKQRSQNAHGLLANANRIEADYQQLTLLTTVLPQLAELAARRQKIAKSKEQIESITAQRGQKQTVLETANSQAKAAQENCLTVEPLIPQLEAHLDALGHKIAVSGRTLSDAKAGEELRKSLDEATQRIDKILKTNSDPDAEFRQAAQEQERLAGLAGALPTLQQFIESRKNRIDAAKRSADAQPLLAQRTADVETAAAERQATDREALAAATAHQQAQNHATEVHTLLKHAQAAMADLDNADGKPQCPTCGQPLTQSHLAEERKRRSEGVDRLTRDKTAANTALQASESHAKDLRRRTSDVNKRQQELAGQIQTLIAASAQAEKDLARTARECRRAYDALPDALRLRISASPLEDWEQSTWPESDDFDRLSAEAKQRAAAAENVRRLDQICSDWRTLTTRAQTLRETLATHAAIPEDLPTLHDAHARLEQEQKETAKRLSNARESLKNEQQTIKRLGVQIKGMEAEIYKLSGQCDLELANQKHDDEACRGIIARLPADWANQAAELSEDSLDKLKAQAQELDQRGIAQAFKDLGEARGALAAIEARIRELKDDIARIPEPARQPPDSIAAQLQQARTDRAQCETARQQAQTRQGELETARRQRAELDQLKRHADRRLRHLEVLCRLLGKKALQLYLVRQIERKIVDCANLILFKLSAGNLRLQLRGDTSTDATDRALDLVAIHQSTAGADPIAVAFLSGSQRFRVAVSLALAIGQIAGNNRCGECVIIDEGFGSLDREGQDVMIQELKHLQGIMKRIILVSHQESFADAFPHGYRFSIQDGEARVERMSG